MEERTFRLMVVLFSFWVTAALLFLATGAEGAGGPPGGEFGIPDFVLEREQPLPPGYRRWGRQDAQAVEVDSGIKFGRRPFDNSDPEMKVLAERFFRQAPCNRGPGKRCPEAKAPLVEGGDRLALYLISQYEQSVAEGYLDTATLVTAIAGTESTIGEQFVEGLLENPRNEREFDFGLSALKECRSQWAVSKALDILARTPESQAIVRASAIRALEVNLKEGRFSRPEALARLRALAERHDSEPLAAAAAARALRNLPR